MRITRPIITVVDDPTGVTAMEGLRL